MRFAYADPPYIGQAKKHYGPDAKEVNHELLIGTLNTFDAWALSLSSPSLEEILHICRSVLGPNQVRVGSWVKPFASYKPNVNPGFCWEPVIVKGGRKLGREVPTVRDFVSANITLQKGVSGAKPEAFSNWLFAFVGLQPDDDFLDYFPGSGAVTRAWEKWRSQGRLVA
jgi:hypothetical protein